MKHPLHTLYITLKWKEWTVIAKIIFNILWQWAICRDFPINPWNFHSMMHIWQDNLRAEKPVPTWDIRLPCGFLLWIWGQLCRIRANSLCWACWPPVKRLWLPVQVQSTRRKLIPLETSEHSVVFCCEAEAGSTGSGWTIYTCYMRFSVKSSSLSCNVVSIFNNINTL